MKLVKSEPKLKKISVDKYDNFFTHKNWKQQMYMDLENDQKNQGETQFKSIQSVELGVKPKLGYSLHQKVSMSLNNNSKLGILDKTPSTAMQKSLARISQNSNTKPQNQALKACTTHLLKLKHELSEVTSKKDNLSQKITNTKAMTNSVREKVMFYENILYKDSSQHENHLLKIYEETNKEKFNQQIKSNMKQTLKSINITLSHRLLILKKSLNQVKLTNQSLINQLNRQKKAESLKKQTTKNYKDNQNTNTTLLQNKSAIAQQRISHQKHFSELKKRYQQIQQYDKHQFDYHTMKTNHQKGMRQIYVQKMFAHILDCNFNKFQGQFLKYENCYAKIRMNSIFHRNQQKLKSVNMESIVQQFDLLPVYYQSFAITQTLHQRITQSENKIQQLQQKRSRLIKKSIEAKLQDGVLDGQKQPQRQNLEPAIKKLIEKDEVIERNKKIMIWIKLWVQKQSEKIGIEQCTKEQQVGTKLWRIIEYMKKECFYMKKQQKELQNNRLQNTQSQFSGSINRSVSRSPQKFYNKTLQNRKNRKNIKKTSKKSSKKR